MGSAKNTAGYKELDVEHCDTNGTSRSHKKTICMIILLIVLAIALCAIVAVLYVKTEQLEQRWQQMELQVEQTEERLEQGASRSMAIPKQVLTNQQITNPEQGYEPKQEDVPGRTEYDEIDKEISIHLTGSTFPLTLRSSSQKSEFQPLGIWQKKEIEGSVAQKTTLTLTNNTYIEIQEDGLYTIYAQLSWRGKRVTAVYQIQRFSKDSSSPETLAQCITNFPERHAILESCHTSVTTQLRKGDLLALSVLRDNMTIDFDDGKSFFGVAQIQSNQEPEMR